VTHELCEYHALGCCWSCMFRSVCVLLPTRGKVEAKNFVPLVGA
jgi:hypothetical protein